MQALRLAVGLLTIIPVTPPAAIERPTARRAILLAPLAVAPLAVVAALLARAMIMLGLPPLVAGLVAVAALAVGTRALHLDGLADTVDGLGSGPDRAKALMIMKTGDVGPMGVVALVLVIGVQAALAGSVAQTWWGGLELTLVIMVSRAGLGLVCRTGVPAAAGSRLGALVAGTVPAGAAWLTWTVWLSVLVAVRLLDPGSGSWVPVVVGALLTTLVLAALLRHVVRRLGGVTGDVMGAAVEVALAVLLLALAAGPRMMVP